MAGEGLSLFTTGSRDLNHNSIEPPKTPDRKLSPSPQNIVRSPRGFKVRRRIRPTTITTLFNSSSSEILAGLQDHPITSIEVPDQETPISITMESPQPSRRLHTPLHLIALPFPQTPCEQRACTPSQSDKINDAMQSPSSPFSSLSDSSDDSFVDSEDEFSYGGSYTSPEEGGANPFAFESPSKRLHGVSQALLNELPSSPTPIKNTPKKCWTKAMDNHIWTIYLTYLNDPTVTPFKTLPGCPPPIGICHRVAGEARKTWKHVRSISGEARLQQLRNDNDDPDTAMEGSEDFMSVALSRSNPPWPGAGSATRKRFRELCKRKATIIPHYQRMLRSPSPFVGESQIKSDRNGSPVVAKDSFATRDIVMSLTTSTATTMQRNGPLARLANDNWFNEVPQGPQVPEQFEIPQEPQQSQMPQQSQDPQEPRTPPPRQPNIGGNNMASAFNTRLDSPFSGSQTWGPIRSRNGQGPPPIGLPSISTNAVPRLRSPVRFSTFGAPRSQPFSTIKTPKRPAQNALEDDAQARRNRHEGIFATTLQNASRRLRLRGMSLGGHLGQVMDYNSEPSTVAGPVVNVLPRAAIFSSFPPVGVSAIGIADPFVNNGPNSAGPIPRLGSPFPGISCRPTRSRNRHLPSLSLPAATMTESESESIDQRMTQDDDDDQNEDSKK